MNELSLTLIAVIVIGVPLFLFLGVKSSPQLSIQLKVTRIEIRQRARRKSIQKRFNKAGRMPAMEQLFEAQTPRGKKLTADIANNEQTSEQEIDDVEVLSEELRRLKEEAKPSHVSAIFFVMAAALYAFPLSEVLGINIVFSLLSTPFVFFGLTTLGGFGFVCLGSIWWWIYTVGPAVFFIGLGLWV